MIRFFFSWFLCIGFIVFPLSGKPKKGFLKRTVSVLVSHLESKKVLYALRANHLVHPASLTKMMTLYTTCRFVQSKLSPWSKVISCPCTKHIEPVKLGIKKNEKVSLQSMLRAFCVKSFNDAAYIIPYFFGLEYQIFVNTMNGDARRMGLKQTYFTNTSGLPHPLQRTTAYDIQCLMRKLYEKFSFEATYYLGSPCFTYKKKTYQSSNTCLKYPGVLFGKTGYTRASGHHLALLLRHKNQHYIILLLGQKNKHRRHMCMMRILQAINETSSDGDLSKKLRSLRSCWDK